MSGSWPAWVTCPCGGRRLIDRIGGPARHPRIKWLRSRVGGHGLAWGRDCHSSRIPGCSPDAKERINLAKSNSEAIDWDVRDHWQVWESTLFRAFACESPDAKDPRPEPGVLTGAFPVRVVGG
jgi:hypothetical protein